MNLNMIAGPVVAVVNPMIPCILRLSIGYTTLPSGIQKPAYAADIPVYGQVQPITWRDLAQLEGINQNGVRWKIYLNGEVNGVVRPESKGGDLVVINGGRHQGEWLVAEVLEQFQDWVCAAIVLQSSTSTTGGNLTADLTNPDNNVIVPTILTGV